MVERGINYDRTKINFRLGAEDEEDGEKEKGKEREK